MTTPAAGWFPDPAGRTDSYRWWDGAAWTRFLTTDPAGPQPQPAAPGPDSTPAAQDDAPTDSSTRQSTRPMPPGYDLGRPQRRGPLALLVPIVVVVAAAALAVGIAVHARSQAAELRDPPPPVASSAQRIDLRYDPVSELVILPSLQVTMPGAPFSAEHTQDDIYGVFSDSVLAEATVQQYAKNQTWIAVVDTGVLNQKLVGADLETTAKNAFNAVVGAGFPDSKAAVRKLRSAALKDRPDKAWIVSGEVHYSVKGVTSTYDKVNMLVVDEGSGRYVGWLSDRPNKSKPAVKKAIDASIKTIKITS